jgi:hypothetical protein
VSFTLDGRIECWLCLLHGVDMSSRESDVCILFASRTYNHSIVFARLFYITLATNLKNIFR